MQSIDLTPAEYAAEYATARQRIRSIVETASAADADIASLTIPACPAWSITNICSHMAGVCRALVERNNPGADGQAWVDGQVADRAQRTLASLLEEWDEFSPRFEALITKYPTGFSGLVLDVVAHEHDICGALGVEGDRTSNGVRACMNVIAHQILNTDLEAHGLGGACFIAGGEEWVCGTREVQLTLDLSDQPAGVWELTRLLGSRRSITQLRAYAWQGDVDRYLPALAHMPLPAGDLVE